MTATSLLTLFTAMFVLALVPGPVVFAVIARAFSSGLKHALYLILGVLFGDFVFIILALFGLSALAQMMGETFVIIKYLSAAYLIWLGVSLLRAKTSQITLETPDHNASRADFLTGFIIALGNPKAIIFYVGFFPAFVDISKVTLQDTALILLVATLAFGSVNLAYALIASKAKQTFTSAKASNVINKTAGSLMVMTGALIAVNN